MFRTQEPDGVQTWASSYEPSSKPETLNPEPEALYLASEGHGLTRGLGFRVWGSGFRVWSSWLRVSKNILFLSESCRCIVPERKTGFSA